MASYQSPLDPLFWIHHCAIDRFWEVWLTLEDRVNPEAKSWLNTSFDFPDPMATSGRRSLFVRDVGKAADAGYSYDNLVPPESAMQRRFRLIEMVPGRRKDDDLELIGASSGGGTVRDRAEIGVVSDAVERRRPPAPPGGAVAPGPATPMPLFLRLENVGVNAGDASSMWNVFIRAGTEGERHLAGTIAPFGLAGLTAQGGRQTLTMDISHLSDDLLANSQPLEITFEPVHEDPEGEPFYERAALYTTAE